MQWNNSETNTYSLRMDHSPLSGSDIRKNRLKSRSRQLSRMSSIDSCLEFDKENCSPCSSDVDMSFYGTPPSESPRCTRKNSCMRIPFEDFDVNSQDLGFHDELCDESKTFQFLEPANIPLRSNSTSDKHSRSPLSRRTLSSSSSTSSDGFCKQMSSPLALRSLSSGSVGSTEGFLDWMENDNATMPNNMSKLLSGDIAINMDASPILGKRQISCDDSPVEQKRHCSVLARKIQRSISVQLPQSRPIPVIQRSVSAHEESIKLAVERSTTDSDLIGDFSKSFALPLIAGKHDDLKSISPETLANLLSGHYSQTVASYKVIDCRYPYEYNGGHIKNALNYYTKEQIMKELLETKEGQPSVKSDSFKRDIIIFHCEFSSHRGPQMSRFLREIDRSHSTEHYPALHYPEVYLLHGGYKEFFAKYRHLCVPNTYLPMNDPAHDSAYRHFRAEARSWNDGKKSKYSSKHM